MSSEQDIKSVAVCDESELKNGEMKQCEFGEDGKVLLSKVGGKIVSVTLASEPVKTGTCGLTFRADVMALTLF
jgi:predicted regulator of Ras-like GTPase activity (Roadblock/LC7/MglB family)